jgi:hypothetical protein
MTSATVLQETRSDVPVSDGRRLVFVSGVVGFSFRPPVDGSVHTETISFLIGGRLAKLYWDVVNASITGASVTPAISISPLGLFVSLPPIPVLDIQVPPTASSGSGGTLA